jgi:hypothetical protein
MHRDVRAEAVAREADGLPGREHFQQSVEIGDVVVEPVAFRLPGTAAEAAQIGGDDTVLARERVDEELERRRDVHPSVQQEQLRRACIAPGQHLGVEPAQCHLAHARRDARNVRGYYFLRHWARPSCQPVR